ncbi:hypothetical protein K469DRAFT_727439 [Zopfia rhizophila CBS 207.26]|uniref:Nudix hydrolase domain-containing protein n=1 Tax=Zopfia rhizophila CBS 207.26 TaxID=1314779 RepID=A0A6A6ERR7_9PEZI|nr:hypothetical protein K469DRAFT_727439 [Zopfia rhizophila CBS 207.26]
MVQQHPRIGITTLVYNADGQIVFGKRKGSHGSSTWAPPGEVLEETGSKTKGHRVVAVTNDIMQHEERHCVTLYVACHLEDPSAQPQVIEPENCEGWIWINLDGTLFLPVLNLLKSYPENGALK